MGEAILERAEGEQQCFSAVPQFVPVGTVFSYVTIASRRPINRLKRVDLPTFGLPIIDTIGIDLAKILNCKANENRHCTPEPADRIRLIYLQDAYYQEDIRLCSKYAAEGTHRR